MGALGRSCNKARRVGTPGKGGNPASAAPGCVHMPVMLGTLIVLHSTVSLVEREALW